MIAVVDAQKAVSSHIPVIPQDMLTDRRCQLSTQLVTLLLVDVFSLSSTGRRLSRRQRQLRERHATQRISSLIPILQIVCGSMECGPRWGESNTDEMA